jgi:hypothetical protein
MRKILLFITLVLSHSTAIACSFAPGYDEFLPSPLYKKKNHPLAIPKASVESIKRGYDDGNGGSCSDAGIIKIKFENENPIRATGYKLKIISGTFESHVIPDYEVMPSRYNPSENSMFFVWLDGSYNNQEKIDFVLQIIAVSPEGDESEPYNLKIRHAGGKSN